MPFRMARVRAKPYQHASEVWVEMVAKYAPPLWRARAQAFGIGSADRFARRLR